MSHNLQLSAAAASASADAVCALLNGGSIEIFSGSQPATADTAITTQVLLATCTFGSPAFAAAVAGVATAHTVTGESDAPASGTAAWMRALTSADAPVFDGTVGAVADEYDCVLSSTAITAHGSVTITSVTFTQATS